MVEILRNPEDWHHTWNCRCGAKLKASPTDIQYGEVEFNAFDSEPLEFYVECPLCRERVVLRDEAIPPKIREKAQGR